MTSFASDLKASAVHVATSTLPLVATLVTGIAILCGGLLNAADSAWLGSWWS